MWVFVEMRLQMELLKKRLKRNQPDALFRLKTLDCQIFTPSLAERMG